MIFDARPENVRRKRLKSESVRKYFCAGASRQREGIVEESQSETESKTREKWGVHDHFFFATRCEREIRSLFDEYGALKKIKNLTWKPEAHLENTKETSLMSKLEHFSVYVQYVYTEHN